MLDMNFYVLKEAAKIQKKFEIQTVETKKTATLLREQPFSSNLHRQSFLALQ
jgi:hypothetical protein